MAFLCSSETVQRLSGRRESRPDRLVLSSDLFETTAAGATRENPAHDREHGREDGSPDPTDEQVPFYVRPARKRRVRVVS
jgi:hypothetical protein